MDYVKVLLDLLSIDNTAPPGRNYERTMDFLQPLFQMYGFETQKVMIPKEYAEGKDDRVNLVCHRRVSGKPRLIFYAHIDVVPAEGWDAFKPWIADGRIYGRGAADMKGAIPALLLAFERVKNKPIKYDTSVIITTDEETGQPDQLRYLGRYLQPLAGAHVWSMDASSGFVGITNLGAMQMHIVVKGKSVHSAMSHLGENAVEKASLLVQELMKLKREVVKRESRVATAPETGLKSMVARLNINMMKGGLKVNIIPDECMIAVDRRLIPEENLEDARKEILDALRSVPDVEWEVASSFDIPPVPPGEDPVLDEIAAIIKEVTGKTGKYGEMGSGDLPHVVASEWGGKEFGLGVIRSDCNIHGKNEFVYQKDIEDLSAIITRFIS